MPRVRRSEDSPNKDQFGQALTLVEAAQAAARFHPEWRSKFLRLAMRRERRIAKVAIARKLAVSMYWMWRQQRSFQPALEVGSYAG